MYQSVGTSAGTSAGDHQTDAGINYHQKNGGKAWAPLPLQGPHEDPEVQLGGPKRSGDVEENDQLRRLVRSLRAELAAARCEAHKYNSCVSQSTRGTDDTLSTHSREDDTEDGSAGGFLAKSYDDTSVYQLIQARSGWLCLFMLSLSLTSMVIHSFESVLERDIQLANFLPLLLGHAGNAGGQTVSSILAALAARQICARDGAWVVAKEGLAGLGVGALVAAASVPFLLVTTVNAHAGITVPFTILFLTGMSSCIGAGLPFLVLRLNLDPNVIAAPATTTVVDVFGIIIYFYIASVVLTIFHLDSSDQE